MRFVASVPDTSFIPAALASGADVIEVRLDLTGPVSPEEAGAVFRDLPVPLIFTVRSAAEGGMFAGGSKEWWDMIEPCLPYATFIDVEGSFRSFAPVLRDRKKTIIASFHTPSMPGPGSLEEMRRDLAAFGDIPKIVVGPRSEEDVLSLLSFTLHAEKPIITSIMGSRFSFIRLMLPFFGSSFIYCHAGSPAAEGQIHLSRAREIMGMFP
ncbi:MAG: type I 3-dehydroquinate dehydratase [Methanolinea sp.]|jgi:3-dehydroquinate dehydratase-1|nr:type I 3-dehydroquinate dehydratase [Methanolinea sp.]